MNKRAFTLIELLAVIVILAIILIIAVPQIIKHIEEVKEKSFLIQGELITDMAEKYHMKNLELPLNNGQALITLQELQTNGYINQNLKDPRTGIIIPNTTGVSVINDGENYKYYYLGYISDGIVLQYDGIYNGGFGIHNNNTSANKTTWKDLSGNNNDGILTGFNYDSTNGWTNVSLRSDVGTFGRVLQSTTFVNMQSFTLEVFGIFNQNSTVVFPRIISTNGSYIGTYEYINGIDLSCHSIDANNALTGRASNGINTNATAISGIGNMGLMSFVYQWDYSTKKLSIYRDGNKLKEYTITQFSNINFDKLGLEHGRAASTGQYIYYSVRVYSRPLLSTEINYNYSVDKSRYGY